MFIRKTSLVWIGILLLSGMFLRGQDSWIPSPTILQGVFIDAAVQGLLYVTPTQQGITDENGTFTYLEGEVVTFYIGGIGGIVLGTGPANSRMTPFDLVPNSSEATDPQVTNISRFLQTLDDDGDPSNGIEITLAVHLAAGNYSINFNQTISDFAQDSNVEAIVSDLTTLTEAGTRELVSVEEAQNHLFPELNCGAFNCLHGICVDGLCECYGGYSGDSCEILSGPCYGIDCGDHGSCVSGDCVCTSGYTGVNCELEPPPCYGIDCGDHGNCVDGDCICTDGFTGIFCEMPPPCYGIDCGDHGNCVDDECICTDGYTGVNCEIPCIPDCINRECGDDGCGGSCGTCDAGYACSGGICVVGEGCGDVITITFQVDEFGPIFCADFEEWIGWTTAEAEAYIMQETPFLFTAWQEGPGCYNMYPEYPDRCLLQGHTSGDPEADLYIYAPPLTDPTFEQLCNDIMGGVYQPGPHCGAGS